MTDTSNVREVLSLIATTSSRIRELPIKNGQLIFIQNLGRIALDFNGNRVFYNQIVELETEIDRLNLEEPLDGYYFVIRTGVLWFYKNEWIQITSSPQEVLSIGVELPKLGQAKENVLYINKTDKEIAVFDSEINDYIIVSNYAVTATDEDIEGIFKKE